MLILQRNGKKAKTNFMKYDQTKTSLLSSFIHERVSIQLSNTNHFYMLPIIGYISTPQYILCFHDCMLYKIFKVFSFSSISRNGSRLIFYVFCIIYESPPHEKTARINYWKISLMVHRHNKLQSSSSQLHCNRLYDSVLNLRY